MSTITTINASDVVADSRDDINNNFSNLNTDKVETLDDLSVTATATELNYSDGVTSNIQTQLDGKSDAFAGEIRMTAKGTAEMGWLLCYGQAVSRTTYADLFTAISTTYGVGNGSTTFNVPDFRGRAPAGLDNMGGASANTITDSNADSLGGTMGTETHTLSEGEIPAHTHTLPDVQQASGSAYDGISAGSGYSNATATGSTGGGGAHNNVQPTMFINFMIKT